jgi:hypothetical protein
VRTARAIACGLLALGAWAAGPEIRLEGGRFVLHGWRAAAQVPPDRWQEALAVFVEGSPAGSPPLLGSHRFEKGALVFEPRFPLQPGMRYRAVARSEPAASAVFEIPARARAAPARVEAVFPTADRLPENQLKLYVHFSAPMAVGEVYRRVRLLDARGKPVELAFLELEQELWDRSGTRVTLLFDPGRIKRGLVPHQEVGPALEAGQRYTLAIDAAWPDAEGQPLASPFRKEFTACEADRAPPDPRDWRITAPRRGTRAPLVLDFPEAMDHALLQRLLGVVDSGGRPVPGAAGVERQETRWSFTPARPWDAGAYSLTFDTALEDLAGNRIGRPFDVDLFERIGRHVRQEIRSVPYSVR